MSGVRISILTCAAFALICLAGFLLLEESAASNDATMPAEAASDAVRPVERQRTMPQAVTAREDEEPPTGTPSDPVSEPSQRAAEPQAEEFAEPESETPPTWSDRVITAPGSRWIRETEREARRLLSLCMETDGHQVAGPVEIAIQLDYDAEVEGGPARRRATVSVQDPYLQACASDSLLDLAYPDPGGPAAFQHTATFAWQSP